MQKYNHLTTRAITINGDWCRWLIMNVLFLHFWEVRGCGSVRGVLYVAEVRDGKSFFLFVRFIFFDYFCILKD